MLAITKLWAYSEFQKGYPMPNINRETRPVPLWSIESLQGRLDLRSIHESLKSYPRDDAKIPASEVTICSRSKKFNMVGFSALTDGVLVVYTTRMALADRSHRFIFPDDRDGVAYHRESFNVDCQAVPSPAVNLEGVKALVTNAAALQQIAFILPVVSGLAKTDWAGREDAHFKVTAC
jgi:hypothetical protein